MKLAGRLLLTTAMVALATSASSLAFADDMALKAPPPPDSDWYTHGDIDFGWRTFIERPPAAPNPGDPSRNNIAGFEQYGQISPGPFLDYLYFGAGSRDGKYSVDFYAKDVGYNDQSYLLQLAQPGKSYLDLGFDQSPWLYGVGTSLWAVNGNSLTTGVKFPSAVPAAAPAQAAYENQINNTVLGQGPMNIGTERSTGSVGYRYTPTPDWDFDAGYAYQKRTGTLPQWGIIETAFGSPAVQLPKPIDDSTQDFRASGEYNGFTPWNTKYNFKVGYNGSIYQDNLNYFTWQNPFGTGSAAAPLTGFLSTPPDNQAHTISATAGVDLPYKSRYMGTMSYEMMRQNEAFGPETVNPAIPNYALPASSLNGAINTFLSNNVLYTSITPDLKSTLKYRYYDYDNQTPTLTFPEYTLADTTVNAVPRSNLVISYVKQDASQDLNWHPASWLNLGETFSWERWDRDHMDANVTDEFTGKVYTDAHVGDWALVRASLAYGERRYDKYDYLDYVANLTYDRNPAETGNDSLMRMFDMANRDRTQGKVLIDLYGPAGITVTPNGGFKLDDYNLNSLGTCATATSVVTTPATTAPCFGVKQDNSWNAGTDFAFVIAHGVTLLASYTHEDHYETLNGAFGSQTVVTGANTTNFTYGSTMEDRVDTYTAAVNIAVIPNSLDFKVSYSYSFDREIWNTGITGTGPFTTGRSVPTIASFPDVTNAYQRVDALVKYRLDPDLVRKLGWSGDIIAKLQYTWERNAVSNWQDLNQPDVWFIDNTATQMVSLAALNPNYEAQMLMGSVNLKW